MPARGPAIFGVVVTKIVDGRENNYRNYFDYKGYEYLGILLL